MDIITFKAEEEEYFCLRKRRKKQLINHHLLRRKEVWRILLKYWFYCVLYPWNYFQLNTRLGNRQSSKVSSKHFVVSVNAWPVQWVYCSSGAGIIPAGWFDLRKDSEIADTLVFFSSSQSGRCVSVHVWAAQRESDGLHDHSAHFSPLTLACLAISLPLCSRSPPLVRLPLSEEAHL